MQQVMVFRTSDGALFENEEEGQEREASLMWRTRVAEFIQSPLCPYKNSAQATMAGNAIIAWEQFKTEKAAAQS